MKVYYTANKERTFDEMIEIWHWMTDTFGPPAAHNDNLKRWTYGKDTPNFAGGMLVDGVHDIEWFDFTEKKDAEWFLLRWQ